MQLRSETATPQHAADSKRESPTVALRRVGIELRRRREQAGYTAKEAADLAGTTTSQVTRYEKAEIQKPSPALVEKLLRVYGITRRLEIELVLSWVEDSQLKGYWHRYRGLTAPHELYLGLEYGATMIRAFESHVIHGMAQTEAYARALIKARVPGADEGFVQERLNVLAERQEHLLSGTHPLEQLWLILDEAMFLRPVGGRETMIAQLEHLKKFANLPNVEFQVLPLSRGAQASAAPLTILTFPHVLDPEVAYHPHPTVEAWTQGRQGVQAHGLIFQALMSASLGKEYSLQVIEAHQGLLAAMPAEVGTHDCDWIDLAKAQPKRAQQ